MRKLRLDEQRPDREFNDRVDRELIIGENVFHQLSLAFPTELVCSGLRELEWHSTHYWLPALRHFLSPTLAQIKISTTPSVGPFQAPLPTIPVLPGSYLRSLHLTFYPAEDEAFGHSASGTILQCGTFLEELRTSARLSKASVSHLLGLRHLRTLRTGSDPPSELPVSPPGIFPSLETFVLDNGVGHKWLSFLGDAQGSGSTDEDLSTSEAGMRTALTRLFSLGGITIDSAFATPLCIFQRLTRVFVDGSCSKEGGCTFYLTDDDITKLADALPDIRSLRLGAPCSANSCHTTTFSLFTLSTRCLRLVSLEIHFNTMDVRHLLGQFFKEPRYERMRSLPRCPLRYLTVADTPISSRDLGSVAIYFSGIFHGLQGFRGRSRKWIEASRKVQLLYNFRSQTIPHTCLVSKISRHRSLPPPPDGRQSAEVRSRLFNRVLNRRMTMIGTIWMIGMMKMIWCMIQDRGGYLASLVRTGMGKDESRSGRAWRSPQITVLYTHCAPYIETNSYIRCPN